MAFTAFQERMFGQAVVVLMASNVTIVAYVNRLRDNISVSVPANTGLQSDRV